MLGFEGDSPPIHKYIELAICMISRKHHASYPLTSNFPLNILGSPARIIIPSAPPSIF
jgi:hypothetical protein